MSSTSAPAISPRVLKSLADPNSTLKTVLVLGGAYGGLQAATTMAKSLVSSDGKGFRVVIVDRNSHFNHLYIFPRCSLLSDHTPKAFIPVAPQIEAPHIYLQSTLLSLDSETATVAIPPTLSPTSEPEQVSIPYTYLVYALGGSLAGPMDISQGSGMKPDGAKRLSIVKEKMDELVRQQKEEIIKGRVLIIGGGALGIQLATDIKEIYPSLEVSLLHSRERLMPRFDKFLHDQAKKRFDALGVKYFLGERAVIPPGGFKDLRVESREVLTVKGTHSIGTDFVITCNGQCPQTQYLLTSFPDSVKSDTSKQARVLNTMQLESGPDTGLPVLGGRLFAIGDCADSQGVIDAGYTAWQQGNIASRNILRMIRKENPEMVSSDLDLPNDQLEDYELQKPAIKLTLGLKHWAIQNAEELTEGDDGKEDLGAELMWTHMKCDPTDKWA
ncbi:Monodehydroascorbate/ferredoxin reductase [Phaffia rhodozyma]|uniref:Monodehydroascorbate/ferredoxin reductase n=1 Tax=Phaffia rhodozyma TaxID=264483 RepID=A0A0F7STT9_PHARH|nr:Monodehydroascorbate/ferredoxin reductase [Phaffia rhodozyma]